MAQRLVKTIRATQVRRIGQAAGADQLNADEIARLTLLGEQFDDVIALRKAGLSPAELDRLAFLRWRLVRAGEIHPAT